ncbi:MAG: bifunctional adenosylcobinamide kinase/adenosylcobinamide-phosphate guanylyltransferase [Acidobacteria bacterium]|nr:bifunctional adenosylcobinamide kinase/adenosylcobinamide-phosphate guanylyltransferase [Acidobacteriota bacterium]
MITLVTGGARSGKSRHALDLAAGSARRVFIATAEAFDDEMRERSRLHRQQRAESFACIEEPVDLAGALRRLPGDTGIAVVDCLTVWLGNLFHRLGSDRRDGRDRRDRRDGCDGRDGRDGCDRRDGRGGCEPASRLEDFPEIGAFLAALGTVPCPLVLVTNEVGLGIIAPDPLTRAFVEVAGRLNQEVAARAERVVLVVCGLPLVLKGGKGGAP